MMTRIVAVALFVGMLAPATVGAQGYKALRTRDGQPDLQGIWQTMNTAAWDIQDHNASLNVPAGLGVVEGNEIPYRPEALAKKAANYKGRDTLDPEKKCFMPGVPRVMYMPYPFQIFQTKDYTAIFYEYIHVQRIIYTDGSKHPEEIQFWMGDSRGRWEGETLVVETTNFNGQTWFDRAGNFHSADLKVTERFTRTGPDHIRYEATIEDPKTFTRPWQMSMPVYRRQEPNIQLLEYECYAYQIYEEGHPLEKSVPARK